MKRIIHWIAEKALNFGMRNAPEHFNATVNTRVEAVSRQVILKVLDQEGLMHCSLCTRRYSLRKHEGNYLCPKHFPELSKTLKTQHGGKSNARSK